MIIVVKRELKKPSLAQLFTLDWLLVFDLWTFKGRLLLHGLSRIHHKNRGGLFSSNITWYKHNLMTISWHLVFRSLPISFYYALLHNSCRSNFVLIVADDSKPTGSNKDAVVVITCPLVDATSILLVHCTATCISSLVGFRNMPSILIY